VSNPLHPDVFPGMINLAFISIALTNLPTCSRAKNGSRGCLHVSQDVRSHAHYSSCYSDINYPFLLRYNNPNGAGTTTSGGTESILMSCKTHREWARDVKGITEPEMYVCDHLLF
jgi:hypothetical protein